nr:polyprenyl synthetase family protein [Paenibacillus soyae]
MSDCIRTWFTTEPMCRHALLFLEDKRKERMLFGELTAIHYRMFGGEHADIEKASAAVELFILASDILDDLEDGDAPDKPWMKLPLPLSVHIATSFITLSQQALLEAAPNAELRGKLAEMTNIQLLRSANGQMLDLMNGIRTEEAYLEMIELKSASLLVWACMCGVMLAGHPWHEKVAEYAKELGIAAQLRNDGRDLMRWDDKSDFLNRKRTLLSMYLMEGDDEQVSWIRDYYEGRLTKSDISEKKDLFFRICEQSGASLYGSVMSRMHYNRFEELLRETDADADWKDKLLGLTAGYITVE